MIKTIPDCQQTFQSKPETKHVQPKLNKKKNFMKIRRNTQNNKIYTTNTEQSEQMGTEVKN